MSEKLPPLYQLPNTYRAIYGRFTGLTDLQQSAIAPILAGNDLILRAATGTGKSEAVLAPCLEKIVVSKQTEAVIYIVPTKSLAKDLWGRFAPVCKDRLRINIKVRTGDIKWSGNSDCDLLITTPESFDVLLGSPNVQIRGFIKRVGTIIIDEAHTFLHQYRGKHLAYLMHRLKNRRGKLSRQLQKIALSATIQNPSEVISYFDFDPHSVVLGSSAQKKVIPRLLHLKNLDYELPLFLNDLYEKWNYRKVLIFTNSRTKCEQLYKKIQHKSYFGKSCYLHYSNLGTKERVWVENRFLQEKQALCIATSTLELGIDIGDVDVVVLFEAPGTAASFLQRIGRGNRRKPCTEFWGICYGDEAARQLIRFLALLSMADAGQLEKSWNGYLPSVIVQQILSCLYENKQISKRRIEQLFGWAHDDQNDQNDQNNQNSQSNQSSQSNKNNRMDNLISFMNQRYWLRPLSGRFELYRGGWRYRDCLLERQLWNCLPEMEQVYLLIVANHIIAELPQSLVDQLELGDHVQLAGKKLCILDINRKGKKKWVTAAPCNQLDDKELLWVGTGIPVSLDVARFIEQILFNKDSKDNKDDVTDKAGILNRTRKLYLQEINENKHHVVLHNGIKAYRATNGMIRYLTFLGTTGNLILKTAIEGWVKNSKNQSKDIDNSSEYFLENDELGIYCSEIINFKQLTLPCSRRELADWVRKYRRLVRPIFPLNAFFKEMPKDGQEEELLSLLDDDRLYEVFSFYLKQSSQILSGDPSIMEAPAGVSAPSCDEHQMVEHYLLLPANLSEPILTSEKKRWSSMFTPTKSEPLSKKIDSPSRLTGSLVGDYIWHNQCKRFLNFYRFGCFVNEKDRNLLPTTSFKQRVFHKLSNEPFTQFITQPDNFIQSLNTAIRCLNNTTQKCVKFLLIQPSLILHKESKYFFGKSKFSAVGRPDLIVVQKEKQSNSYILQIENIVGQSRSSYHHIWQTAFYDYLLEALISNDSSLNHPVKTKQEGRLLLRQELEEEEFHTYCFDLNPYRTNIPYLLEQINQVLSNNGSKPEEIFYPLEGHCRNCKCFDTCYTESLRYHDLRLLDGITTGQINKLHNLGIKRYSDISGSNKSNGINDPNKINDPNEINKFNREIFSVDQYRRLQNNVFALINNKVIITQQKTRLFPVKSNLSIHIEIVPGGNIKFPLYLGVAVFIVNGPRNLTPECFEVWKSDNEDNKTNNSNQEVNSINKNKKIKNFFNRLGLIWQEAVNNEEYPHLYCYGQAFFYFINEWKSEFETSCPFLYAPHRDHVTNLKQVLKKHVILPVPGKQNRYWIGQVLGFEGALSEPISLLHDECDEFVNRKKPNSVDSTLEQLILWQKELLSWLRKYIVSDKHKSKEDYLPVSLFHQIKELLLWVVQNESRLRRDKILEMQKYSLKERVMALRAIGPLEFLEMTLNEEGRTVYRFSIDRQFSQQTKIRPGDFLKLALINAKDIQDGWSVILTELDLESQKLSLLSRQRKLPLMKSIYYSLEEDAADFTLEQLESGIKHVFGEDSSVSSIWQLINGDLTFSNWQEGVESSGEGQSGFSWVEGELERDSLFKTLNFSQKQALRLPFNNKVSIVEGPPGTGKTYLLACMLLALMKRAMAEKSALRIVISAMTHEAIDNVLSTLVKLVNFRWGDDNSNSKFKLSKQINCYKFGKFAKSESNKSSCTNQNQKIPGDQLKIEPLVSRDEIMNNKYVILGATGYGLHKLFGDLRQGPKSIFDWVLFDESSQVLFSLAILTMMFGKGNYIFSGDVKQLPPILLGDYQSLLSNIDKQASVDLNTQITVTDSVLANLLRIYGNKQKVRLTETYRMNKELCLFPSKMWYESSLISAVPPKEAYLSIKYGQNNYQPDSIDSILDPRKTCSLVLVDHEYSTDQSEEEAKIVSKLTHRLMLCYGITCEQLAIISPHRAQNNLILSHISSDIGGDKFPLIDTVERIQGKERDVIIYSMVASDVDAIKSRFINDPNRFNVAITRAKKKLIVVGSRRLFRLIPADELILSRHTPLKEFEQISSIHNANFVRPTSGISMDHSLQS